MPEIPIISEIPESISHIKIGINEHPIDAVLLGGFSSFQEKGKIVTSINLNSTDEEIPSAKCLYEMIYGPTIPVPETEPSYAPDYDPTYDPDFVPDFTPDQEYENQINNYLSFDVLSDGNITWNAQQNAEPKTISYSKNNGAWTDITSTTSGTAISVITGDKIRFKGLNHQYSSGSDNDSNYFNGTATFNISGNIRSLSAGDNFTSPNILDYSYQFEALFSGCTGLISAEYLSLPSTYGLGGCYRCMFEGCTNLTKAPQELPATTVSSSCYRNMFLGCSNLITAPVIKATKFYGSNCFDGMFAFCTSLTKAPELPAATCGSCYAHMFYGCTSLTKAPELPATTLADRCYQQMFYGCTSLTKAPELPATTLAEGCYGSMFSGCTSLITAPELPATQLAYYCYSDMFSDCTSLTTAPELPATTLTEYCYYAMFNRCTSLTSAPILPASKLVKHCYGYMFFGCTSLNYIACYATELVANDNYYYIGTESWVQNVAPTGTFVKHPSMSSWRINSYSGIPIGWTVTNSEYWDDENRWYDDYIWSGSGPIYGLDSDSDSDSEYSYDSDSEYNYDSDSDSDYQYSNLAGDIVLSDGVQYYTCSPSKLASVWDSSKYTVEGVVVVPNTHTPDGSTKIISLASMSLTTPDTGNLLENETMMFGSYGYDIPEITNWPIYSGTVYEDGINYMFIRGYGFLPSDLIHFDGINSSDPLCHYRYRNWSSGDETASVPYILMKYSPQTTGPYDANGEPNEDYLSNSHTSDGISETGLIGYDYSGMTNFNGEANTNYILSHATGEDWRTVNTLTNSSDNGYYPAAEACARYHTVNTSNWYLPSVAELGYLIARCNKINQTIDIINEVCGNGTALHITADLTGPSLTNDVSYVNLITSAECNENECLYVDTYGGGIRPTNKNNNNNVRAFASIPIFLGAL